MRFFFIDILLKGKVCSSVVIRWSDVKANKENAFGHGRVQGLQIKVKCIVGGCREIASTHCI